MRVIRPNWSAPPQVIAFTTTRQNGHSNGRFDSLNIADHVGDVANTVVKNRDLLAAQLPDQTAIQWLSQVHGRKVIKAPNALDSPVADGSWTDVTGVACAVMSADCLPILLTGPSGEGAGSTVIAAIHAGWRGLAGGVVESCIARMPVDGSQLMAWLGPAIGAGAFEVGEDVRESFVFGATASTKASVLSCFAAMASRPGFYLADIYALARLRLAGVGVVQVYGGQYCTYTDQNRFYSYRRDGDTGRMATVIALNPHLK